MDTNPKLELTQAIVDKLTFERQPVMRAGKLVWRTTPPGTHDWYLHDTKTSGLRIRLTPAAATWIVRRKLNGRPVRRAMGSARSGEAGQFLTLSEARRRCEAWRGLMAQGHDPLLERKRIGVATAAEATKLRVTMREAYNEFVDAQRDKAKPTTTKDRLKVGKWMEQSPLWRCPVSEVNKEIVKNSLQPLLKREIERKEENERDDREKGDRKQKLDWGPAKPGSTKKIYIYARVAWLRAAEDQKIEGDPFKKWQRDIKWPEDTKNEKKNKGRLPPAGINSDRKKWLRALVKTWKIAHERDDPMVALLADFYILVLLWGTRLNATCHIAWADVDTAEKLVWMMPKWAKTKTLGTVPITLWADQILKRRRAINREWRPRSPWVFPSVIYKDKDGVELAKPPPLSNPRKALGRLTKETGVRISTHDLRRTHGDDIGVESKQAEGKALTAAGAALGHARGSKVTKAYLRPIAHILRPIYQRREDSLRELAGLQPLGGTSNKPTPTTAITDDVIQSLVADPEMRKRLFKMLAEA